MYKTYTLFYTKNYTIVINQEVGSICLFGINYLITYMLNVMIDK